MTVAHLDDGITGIEFLGQRVAEFECDWASQDYGKIDRLGGVHSSDAGFDSREEPRKSLRQLLQLTFIWRVKGCCSLSGLHGEEHETQPFSGGKWLRQEGTALRPIEL